MTKYLDLTPPRRPPTDPRWALWISLLFGLLVVSVVAALGAEVPPEATLMGTQPVPCGLVKLYDTDRNLANGAEFHVLEGQDGTVAAIVEFAPGDHGEFRAAVIKKANGAEELVTNLGEFRMRAADTCKMIEEAGRKT